MYRIIAEELLRMLVLLWFSCFGLDQNKVYN